MVSQVHPLAHLAKDTESNQEVAAAFNSSSFNEATAVFIGGKQTAECLSVWTVSESNLTSVFRQPGVNNIGLWFNSMLTRANISLESSSSLLMRMKRGNPNKLFLDVLNDFIDTVGCGYDPTTKIKKDLAYGCLDWRNDLVSEQDLCDIAAATQGVYVYVLHNILAWCKKSLPSQNLLLVGEVELGCLDRDDLRTFFASIEYYSTLKSLTKTIKVL